MIVFAELAAEIEAKSYAYAKACADFHSGRSDSTVVMAAEKSALVHALWDNQVAILECLRMWRERRTMGDWQPIETAPQDGTWVDLWAVDWNDNGKRIPNCIWDEKWLTFAFPDYFPGLDNCVNAFMKDDSFEPTHWMPLPTPPKAA